MPRYQPKTWNWSKDKDLAAKMNAEGSTGHAIAAAVGISEVTFYNWKQVPEFEARIQTYLRAWTASMVNQGIGRKGRRMQILNQMAEAQEEIRKQRAVAHGKKKKIEVDGVMVEEPIVPGGDTGFMVIKTRRYFEGGGVDEAPQEVIIEEVAFDAPFSREMRATLQQAGEEAGELVTKTEISGPGGGPIGLSIAGLDEIAAKIKMAKEAVANEDDD